MVIEVGVVGRAGVGKSSLLNALVSPGLPILTQGGIGPLTAALVELVFAQEPYMAAHYYPRAAFAELERAVRSAPNDESLSVRAAHLLLHGKQFGAVDRAELVAGLAACGDRSEAGSSKSGSDRSRVEHIRRALTIADATDGAAVVYASQDLPQFLSELQNHAAGFLAPITRALRIGWNAPLLESGVTLVDLPGVGVANDIYGNATRAWLENASHVLVVVGREGITEETEKALVTTGFLSRLLAGTVRMVVVATQLDTSATDARRAHAIRSQGKSVPWPHHFERIQTSACDFVAQQVRKVVGDAAQGDDEQRVRAAVGRIHVHAVSALEHQLLFRNDPEERSKISFSAQSGVPAVAERLMQLATEAGSR